jgi:2-iminobutanoate/2-iminopropanoate deaminase
VGARNEIGDSPFPKIVELRGRYFTPPYPADTIVEVTSLYSPQALIEIEAIAVVNEAVERT